MSPRLLVELYYSLVYPYLLYGNAVWGSTHVAHLTPLVVIQKKLTRIITKSDCLAHTDPLFKQCNILKIGDLTNFVLAQYMYKLRLTDTVRFAVIHSFNTLGRLNAVPVFHRLTLTKHALSYFAPRAWNGMPPHIQSAATITQFKRQLKSHYI